jgi:hypothetical protein
MKRKRPWGTLLLLVSTSNAWFQCAWLWCRGSYLTSAVIGFAAVVGSVVIAWMVCDLWSLARYYVDLAEKSRKLGLAGK